MAESVGKRKQKQVWCGGNGWSWNLAANYLNGCALRELEASMRRNVRSEGMKQKETYQISRGSMSVKSELYEKANKRE